MAQTCERRRRANGRPSPASKHVGREYPGEGKAAQPVFELTADEGEHGEDEERERSEGSHARMVRATTTTTTTIHPKGVARACSA